MIMSSSELLTLPPLLITGVAGRTGSLIFQRILHHHPGTIVRGLARSLSKAEQVLGTREHLWEGDIRQPETLKAPLAGCEALIIVTSAQPRPLGIPQPGSPPEFGFAEGEMPEAIDYWGQIHQIEAAKAAGIKHIVLIGSMGGTNPNHPLNRLGNGNILIWKGKAETYLMNSGIPYTIVRAGGLLDEPGEERRLLVGQRDELLEPGDFPPAVPRADVARVALEALRHPIAQNLAFDLISQPPGQGEPTQNFGDLFQRARDALVG